jgi:transketolase
LIGTGELSWRAVEAARILETFGISCGVIGMPSIRPFDEQAVLHAARNSRVVITAEEHSIHGGLGSRVAALLMEHELSPRFKIIGIPDEPTVAGSQEEIFNHYGITPEKIAETARQTLEKESVG